MKTLHSIAALALLTSPAWVLPAETVMTRKVHTDAYTLGKDEIPAKDFTQTVWMAKDKLRFESEDRITIVRLDQKKMFVLSPKDKTAASVDLPFDFIKSLPPDMPPMAAKMMADIKASVTPTDETKKIRDWEARKFQMTLTTPMGSGMQQEIWASKSVPVDVSAYKEMMRAMISVRPGGDAMGEEMKKVEGIPVMTTRTQNMGSAEIKTTEELTSVEPKDAPEGTFDVPADYTEKPFEPMADFKPRSVPRHEKQ